MSKAKAKPSIKSKVQKFIVRAPITVTVCIEVSAISAEQAIRIATEEMDELVPSYLGIGSDLDRPTYLEAPEGWFEGYDQNGIFINATATPKRNEK
jgi:hypothetical protein